MTESLPSVAALRDGLDHAVRWNSAGGAFEVAQRAVAALQRLADAEPAAVFGLIDELRGAEHGAERSP